MVSSGWTAHPHARTGIQVGAVLRSAHTRPAVKVGQQHPCSGHALAQRCAFMGHQRQQPLQRVVRLRQATYQPGLVAAACRPSCPAPATSPTVHRLDCFRHGGIFCAWQAGWFPKACTSRLWSRPPGLAVQYLHHALVLQAAIPCVPSLRTNFCAPGNGAVQSNKNNSQGVGENSEFVRLRPVRCCNP